MPTDYIDDSQTGLASDSVSSGDRGEPSGDLEDRSDEGGTGFNKVALDWVELEAALENNSPELHSFLNTVTGDVIRVFETTENADSRLKQAEASPDFVFIEPISSRAQYNWMEEFIEKVQEPELKDKLNIAIDGKGAFRRFKDVLVGYPMEREEWFSQRSIRLREHMQQWLKSKRVAPTNTPPWEGGEDERPAKNDPGLSSRYEGSGDLRVRAHEVLDSVPTRELSTALAFLEFLRSRRDPRRGR